MKRRYIILVVFILLLGAGSTLRVQRVSFQDGKTEDGFVRVLWPWQKTTISMPFRNHSHMSYELVGCYDLHRCSGGQDLFKVAPVD
jgi:hypothetical protein